MQTRRLQLATVSFLFVMAAPCWAREPERAKLHLAKQGQLTLPLCEMLGMADEYISRFDIWDSKPRPRLVEHFYPHEKALADHYAQLIQRQEKAARERYQAPLKLDRHGHYVFYSQRLANLINSFYVMRGQIATLDAARLLGAPEDCRLRYVQGAYRRYHEDDKNTIMIANGANKVETIGRVLLSLGATDVALLSTESIPVFNALFFLPGNKLARSLPIKTRITKAAFARRPHRATYYELKGKRR